MRMQAVRPPRSPSASSPDHQIPPAGGTMVEANTGNMVNALTATAASLATKHMLYTYMYIDQMDLESIEVLGT